jgi:hypothetical protein
MHAKRWLLFLGVFSGLGGLVWLTASPPPLLRAQAKQARGPGAGAHGTVFVRPSARAEGRRDEPVVLPDFELALKNVDTGDLSAPQKTNLAGRFMFPPQKQGTYKLVWKKQNGWDEGEHPEPVVVTNHTQYPGPVEIKPQKGLVVLTGRVRLADGGSPWYANEFFGVTRFAEVELTDAGDAKIGNPVRANFAGDYAIAAEPKTKFHVSARSSAAKVTHVLTPADFLPNGTPKLLDLKLDNHRPRLDAVVTQVGGLTVRHAAPGETVKLVALASDPDKDPLEYTWKTDSGTLKGSGAAVDWQLPRQPGIYFAYVVISDGRGGDVQGQVSVTVGAKGDTFSGRTVDSNGKPVVKAAVAVNDQKTVTDANGYFQVTVPVADRYVLNISQHGFAPLSRLFDKPSNGHIWKLVSAQVSDIDPAKPIDLVDRRPILERQKLKGARVQVPAGALVDPAGNRPAGNLRAAIATLDLGKDEAPGDWIAKEGGMDFGLISYGVAFVEFTDATGKKYNLSPGQKAEVTIPVPASVLAKAPPQMPIWTYDEKDGYWKSLNTVAALDHATGSYKGQVPHLSTINMDQTGPVSCVRVHSDVSIPTGLKLRSSGIGFAVVKETVMDGRLNAVFRIPAGGQVKLEVLDINGNLLPNVVVEDGNTTGAIGTPLPNNTVTAGPADPNLWPPSPYTECKPVTLKLNALWSGYPSSAFLALFKGAGDAASANAYYQVVDPPVPGSSPPKGRRTTLADWWSVNGYDSSGNAAGDVRTSYLNNNDLGSGRDMHFLAHADGTLSAYVTNYSHDGTGLDLFDQNPAYADQALAQSPAGATVCMEYSPVEGDPSGIKIVKFFVFADKDGLPGVERQPAADLDGFGGKFVPNLCTNCHGGSYYNPASPTLADVNMGSSFRELDLSTYKFPGFRTTPNTAEQAAFKQQNQMIRATPPFTSPTVTTSVARQPILDLIDGWYFPGGMGTTQDNTYTPGSVMDPKWQGAPQQGLYHDVVKVSCRTCHIAFDSTNDQFGLDWNRYDQFKRRRNNGLLPNYAIGTSISGIPGPFIRIMPHALVTYRNFWLDQSPNHRPTKLWEYNDSPGGWAQIGPPLP